MGGVEAFGLAIVLAVVALFLRGRARTVVAGAAAILLGVFLIASAIGPRDTRPIDAEPVQVSE